MMGKSFTITSQEPCTRCACFGQKREACVAVKEKVRGVTVHSALCEEHFLRVEKKKKTFFSLFFHKGGKS